MILLGLWGAHAIYDRLPLHRSTLSARILATNAEACTAVTAALSGRMDTRERCAHPHSPFLFLESEPDGFSGSLRVGDQTYDIEESRLVPIGVLRTRSGIFVLQELQDCGRWWPRFRWSASEGGDRLKPVRAADVAKQCGDLELDDTNRNRLFTFWTLEQLYDEQPERACAALLRIAAKRPRFAFQTECEYPCGSDAEWPVLLNKHIMKHAASCPSMDELYAALRNMLDASTESDDMQDVRFVMYALYSLDKSRGTALVKDFIERTPPGNRRETAYAFLREMRSVEEKGDW
jgi:hypothetical protein